MYNPEKRAACNERPRLQAPLTPLPVPHEAFLPTHTPLSSDIVSPSELPPPPLACSRCLSLPREWYMLWIAPLAESSKATTTASISFLHLHRSTTVMAIGTNIIL